MTNVVQISDLKEFSANLIINQCFFRFRNLKIILLLGHTVDLDLCDQKNMLTIILEKRPQLFIRLFKKKHEKMKKF